MSYQPKALRALLAAGLTAVLCAGATATALPAVAAETKLRVVQHNTDQKEQRWNDVLKLADNNDVLLAEEVCEVWYEKAKMAHPGWTFSLHRQTLTPGAEGAATCPESENGTKEGKTWKGLVAVHTGKGDIKDIDFYGAEVNKEKGKIFGMACVDFRKAGKKVMACATHLELGSEAVRTEQTQKIKKITKEWIKKDFAVVVGGDFNSQPGTDPMSNMYQYGVGSEGKFVEGHQLKTGEPARTGKNTVDGRKIDYVFFDAKHTPLKSGGPLKWIE
ncbi:endonuclease/exonuclease/phosphatase family protein [Arthrobacter sp. SA17]